MYKKINNSIKKKVASSFSRCIVAFTKKSVEKQNLQEKVNPLILYQSISSSTTFIVFPTILEVLLIAIARITLYSFIISEYIVTYLNIFKLISNFTNIITTVVCHCDYS